jgi:hypothetical protein
MGTRVNPAGRWVVWHDTFDGTHEINFHPWNPVHWWLWVRDELYIARSFRNDH